MEDWEKEIEKKQALIRAALTAAADAIRKLDGITECSGLITDTSVYGEDYSIQLTTSQGIRYTVMLDEEEEEKVTIYPAWTIHPTDPPPQADPSADRLKKAQEEFDCMARWFAAAANRFIRRHGADIMLESKQQFEDYLDMSSTRMMYLDKFDKLDRAKAGLPESSGETENRPRPAPPRLAARRHAGDGPWTLYRCDNHGYYNKQRFDRTSRCRYEHQLTVFDAKALADDAIAQGHEVRVTDSGDWVVFHSAANHTIYGETFWDDILRGETLQ
jgi:hypothetical protein